MGPAPSGPLLPPSEPSHYLDDHLGALKQSAPRDVIRSSLPSPAPPPGGPFVTSSNGPETPARVGLFLTLVSWSCVCVCVSLSYHGSLPADRRAQSTFLSPPDEGQEAAAGPG